VAKELNTRTKLRPILAPIEPKPNRPHITDLTEDIPLTDDQAKARANTQFMRALQAEDGRKAMAEYEAKAAATREKTERLRALRLAKEAEDAKAAPVVTTKAKGKGKSAKKPARVAGKLSDWLEEQQDSGRST
jgi:hypothetical protein